MHPYDTPRPPLILLGAWPVHEWLCGDTPNAHARWAFVWQVALADMPADDKLDAADLYRDHFGDRELLRALRLADRQPGHRLDGAMAAVARGLMRQRVAA